MKAAVGGFLLSCALLLGQSFQSSFSSPTLHLKKTFRSDVSRKGPDPMPVPHDMCRKSKKPDTNSGWPDLVGDFEGLTHLGH